MWKWQYDMYYVEMENQFSQITLSDYELEELYARHVRQNY